MDSKGFEKALTFIAVVGCFRVAQMPISVVSLVYASIFYKENGNGAGDGVYLLIAGYGGLISAFLAPFLWVLCYTLRNTALSPLYNNYSNYLVVLDIILCITSGVLELSAGAIIYRGIGDKSEVEDNNRKSAMVFAFVSGGFNLLWIIVGGLFLCFGGN